jgi:uncharacterized surface protein with fasciclin (FAS1) repeats
MQLSRRRLGLTFATAALAACPGVAFAKNVLQVADETGAFSFFLKAVKYTGMRDFLYGAGPFTLFAPTDDAFTKLPKTMLNKMFDEDNPAGKEKLRALLYNHVLNGVVMTRDIANRRREAVTVPGGILLLDGTHGFTVDNAKITKSDIMADNGVVHVIDTVLVPR